MDPSMTEEVRSKHWTHKWINEYQNINNKTVKKNRKLCPILLKVIYYYFLLFGERLCHGVCGGHRTTSRSQFFSYSMWALAIGLRLSGLVTKCFHLRSYLASQMSFSFLEILLFVYLSQLSTDTSVPQLGRHSFKCLCACALQLSDPDFPTSVGTARVVGG